MDLEILEKKFEDKFGHKNTKMFFAPGRVNLIGEHTDYNAGKVLPCTISYGTYLAFSSRNDNNISLASCNFEFQDSFDINTLDSNEKNWVKYPMAVIQQFLLKGLDVSGMNMMFLGNIPTGAGLSSSASVELVTAVAINEHFKFNIPQVELVKMSQKAENEFVGVSCGIMDQFAVGMGQKGKAIYLNCNSLEYTLVDFKLEDYCLIIADTKKQRCLADSKYNERCSECAQAVEAISKSYPIDNLCQLTSDLLHKYANDINNKTTYSRAKHVVSENERVQLAVDALNNNDIIQLGKLMVESHQSLRYDYQVTGFELDTMVDLSLKCKGVVGARMTGAGFGGCAIALVHKKNKQEYIDTISTKYHQITGLKPEFYIVNTGMPASRIK